MIKRSNSFFSSKLLLMLIFWTFLACWSVCTANSRDDEILLLLRYFELEQDYTNSLKAVSSSDHLQSSQQNQGISILLEPKEGESSVKPTMNSSLIVNHGFWKNIEGLGYCFAFVFLSEIGDKTFLIILLVASRMKGTKLFINSSVTLCCTHFISALLGSLLSSVFGEVFLRLISIVVFTIFGSYLIISSMKKEEVNIDHQISELEQGMTAFGEEETDDEEQHKVIKYAKDLFANETFRVVFFIFIAEFGDRSQILTVGLTSFYKFWVVIVSGIYGHIAAIIIAITFGRMISQKLKENYLKLIGGILFLLFCCYSVIAYFIIDI